MDRETPVPEPLSSAELRASFGITAETGGFEDNPGDKNDAKDALAGFKEVQDEDEKLNKEKKENTLSRDEFVEAVRLMMYSNKENEDKPDDRESAKKEKKRRREGKPKAISLLRNNGVDVDYLMGSTEISGDDKKERSVKGAERRRRVKMVNAGIARKELVYTEEVDDILVRMNVDEKKMNEWGVVAMTRDERVQENVRPEDGVQEENDREPRKNIEKYIRENEKKCLDHFARFFDANVYNPRRSPDNLNNIKFLREFLDNIPDLQRDFENNYEEMFKFAQDIYFGQIMPKSYAGMRGESDSILQRENINDEIDEPARERLRGRIITSVELVVGNRKWNFTNEMLHGGKVLLDFLEKRFNTPEVKNDKDGLELAFKYFKDSYMGQGEVPPNETKMDSMKLNESQRETVISVLTVRNLARDLDKATSFENLGKKYTAADSAIKNIMNMDLPDCDKPVARIMEWYISAMFDEWTRNRSVGVDIDSPAIRTFIEGKWSRTFPNENELKMLMEMARDMIRVTGMDAQFFMPYDGVSDPIKPERGGNFLSGAINFERKIKTKYSSLGELVGGVNFGLVPFMRKLEGEENERKWARLKFSDIVNLTNNKFQGLAYTGWLNSFDGIVNLQKGEEDFIKSPSIKTFFETVIPLYNKAKKDKGIIKTRIKNVVEFFADTGLATYDDFSVYLTELTTKDGVYNGFGVFDKPEELEEFFDDLLVTDIDTSSVVNTASYNISRSTRRERNTAIKNALATPFRALGRLIRRH